MTLTHWFRKYQRHLIAGLVVMLMFSWGVLGTLSTLVRQRGEEKTIHGHVVGPVEMGEAEGALRLTLALGLAEPLTSAYMEQLGAPLRAVTDVGTLGWDVRSFVFQGESLAVNVDSAWRYMLLLYEAQASGVQVSQAEVRETIEFLPILTDRTGFSMERYQGLLRVYSMTDAQVGLWMTQLLQIARLVDMRRESVVVSDAELWMLYAHRNETARMRMAPVEGSLFLSQVKADDDELRQFYDEHRDLKPADSADGIGYMAPDRIRVEYAIAPLADLEKQVTVSDEEVAAHYDQNKSRYIIPDTAGEAAPPQPAGATPTEAQPKPVRYKPLEEVKDEIRKELVTSKASQKALEATEKALTDLRALGESYENMPLPLEQMARRHGLTYNSVRTPAGSPLVTAEELASVGPVGEDAVSFAFAPEGGSLYYPESYSSDQGPFIMQVLERRAPEARPFEEVTDLVRSDVLRVKALEDAQIFADKLRDRAAEIGLDAAVAEMGARLSDLLGAAAPADRQPLLKVTETAFFRRGMPTIEGVSEQAVEELAAQAFQTAVNEVAVVAVRPPVATAYVIQPVEFKGADPQEFARVAGPASPFYRSQKQDRALKAWMDDLLAKWPPATKEAG